MKITKEKNDNFNSTNHFVNSKSNLSNNFKKININIIPIHKVNIKKNSIKNLKKVPITYKKSLEPKSLIIKKKKEYKYLNSMNLNDYELNSLSYKMALKIDKRTYIQYYWSLLKSKQLILFTFFPNNDYNLLTVKIILFLLSFSIFFTINGFFFSDDTMHNIHKVNGSYDILFRIPQIFYSLVICSIINTALRFLSLSEKNIIHIKQEKSLIRAYQKEKEIRKNIKIKFLFFFILCNILLLFFWYFISCFCVVYTNTQIILIKDTLISFGTSMIDPFWIDLIPGIFRILALRAKLHDKECIYQMSWLIATFI